MHIYLHAYIHTIYTHIHYIHTNIHIQMVRASPNRQKVHISQTKDQTSTHMLLARSRKAALTICCVTGRPRREMDASSDRTMLRAINQKRSIE